MVVDRAGTDHAGKLTSSGLTLSGRSLKPVPRVLLTCDRQTAFPFFRGRFPNFAFRLAFAESLRFVLLCPVPSPLSGLAGLDPRRAPPPRRRAHCW
jgi:hypothetical protein